MAYLALESTVIAHGLPYPDNLATARELEQIARQHGVEPRTIAIIAGQIKVGLSDEELEHLATAKPVMKVSRRDTAVAVAGKKDGATTVSATMYLAYRAGIQVFATGGIGGVHRAPKGSQSWDVSADLEELASTSVAVVCAGAKAVLNLPATLEYLETHNVPVLGFGTSEFPAFYSRTSALRVQARVDTAAKAAEIIQTHWGLGNRSGVLICVPVPEQDEIPRQVIDLFINRVVEEAEEQQIIGGALTPFLLRRLSELTKGASVRTNISLLRNNVKVAAQIALELDSQTKP